MNDEFYKRATVLLGNFAQALQQELDLSKMPEMETDRMMIMFKVREIQGYMNDMNSIYNVHNHPDTLHVEMRKKNEGRSVEPI